MTTPNAAAHACTAIIDRLRAAPEAGRAELLHAFLERELEGATERHAKTLLAMLKIVADSERSGAITRLVDEAIARVRE